MTDEEFKKIMNDLLNSGRAFEALKYLTELVSNYTNNLEVVVREAQAEHRAIRKFIDSDMTPEERAERYKRELKSNEELLEQIFGTKDIADYQLNEEEIGKIREVVAQIEASWESEAE